MKKSKYSPTQWEQIMDLHVQNGCRAAATERVARARFSEFAHLRRKTIMAFIRSEEGGQIFESRKKANQEKIDAKLDSLSPEEKAAVQSMSILQMWTKITKDTLVRGMAGDIESIRLGIELLRVAPCVPKEDPSPYDDDDSPGGNPHGQIPKEPPPWQPPWLDPPVAQPACTPSPANPPAPPTPEPEPPAPASAQSQPPAPPTAQSDPPAPAAAPAPSPDPAAANPNPAPPVRPAGLPASWILGPEGRWIPTDEDDYPPSIVPPRYRNNAWSKGTRVITDDGIEFRWGIDPWPKQSRLKWRVPRRGEH